MHLHTSLSGLLIAATIVISLSSEGRTEETEQRIAYRQIATSDKVKDRDLSFCLTFDGKSVSADLAKGNPDSSTFGDGNLEFRTVPGFDGQNAFNRRADETLHYLVDKNIDHRQGSVVFWIMAKDYDPGGVAVSDPVKTHKPYFYARFANGKEWVTLFFYQYFSSPTANFYWRNSHAERGKLAIASAPLTGVKAGQWIQLAATWDDQAINVYLNGQWQSKAPLPVCAAETMDLVPNPRQSLLGIRQMMWKGAPESGQTVIDDIKIFSRPLTALEIQRQYQALVASVTAEDLPPFELRIDGVDDGKGPLDRLAVSVDLTPVPAPWLVDLRANKVSLNYTLTLPDNSKQSGVWDLTSVKTMRLFDGVSQPGDYQIDLELKGRAGRREQLSRKFQRPNTDWYGNRLGLEDEVPTPWVPVLVDEENTVKVWGREYRFAGDSPLPTAVIHQGSSLLLSPPRLIVETSEGEADIRYVRSKKNVETTFVEFQGTGKSSTFTLDWTTRIEFDGMIRCDFIIHGEPVVTSMKLVWNVGPRYSRFLLTPTMKTSESGDYAFPLNLSDRRSVSQLWLTSARKGFCWTLEHDANWVYDKDGRPLRVRIDSQGGHCEVRMIDRSTKLPADVPYHAIFMATPARPLPVASRTYRLGSGGGVRYRNHDVAIVSHQGAGLTSVFTFKPDSDFGDYMDQLARRGWVRNPLGKMDHLAIYGGATALNNHELEGRYFGRYWELPGGPIVPFHDKRAHHEIKCLQTNTCPNTAYSDYILNNIRLLFDHPKQRVSAIYYDLAGNTSCSNALHGCQFRDRFGRTISRMILMGLRKHLRRTTQYCHARGRVTIYHAHSYYNPVCHSFADYWYPGEQYCSLMQRRKSPYVYSDEIPDAVYRSELNMHLHGSGILFLPNLSRADKSYGTTEQTEAMMTRLLLNDVPVSMAFCDGAVIDRWWGIARHYNLDDAQMHFHDEQQEITSDNEAVKVSYYTCDDGRILIIAGNTTARDQIASLNLSGLRAGARISEQYVKNPIQRTGQGVRIVLPARGFGILGLRK